MNAHRFFKACAASGKLEQLVERGGVKFVSDDNADFLATSNWVASQQQGQSNATTTTAAATAATGGCTILYAPEPKLQGFALQSPYAGAVLAEDFYAPTYLRMRGLYEAGDAAGAVAEQNWKQYAVRLWCLMLALVYLYPDHGFLMLLSS